LLKASTDLRTSLTDKEQQVQQAQSQASQLQQDLTQNKSLLEQKTLEIQRISQDKDSLMQDYDKFKTVLSAVNANTFNTIIQMGVGMTFKDLARIPVADYNLNYGNDTDGDGLSELAEEALGTNKNNKDTDGDGYEDKKEAIDGYDPLNNNKYPIDLKFANTQKGKILLAVQGNNEAWYVSPKDGKRYFLGRPTDAVSALEGTQKSITPTSVTTTVPRIIQ
jgi:hypothetical protein